MTDYTDTTVTYYYADWCGPCKQIKPIIDEIDTDRDDVAVERVDVEDDQERMNANNVTALPTIDVSGSDGTKRLTGSVSTAQITSAIDEVQST